MPSKDFTRSAPRQPHAQRNSSQSNPSTPLPNTTRPLKTNAQFSHHGNNGIKCSIKANEGLLFCLDKSFMFVPKPATYIQIENVAFITMSRVGGAVSASRTFDITMTLKNGMGEHQFSNINRLVTELLPRFLYGDPFLTTEILTVRNNNHSKTSSRLRTSGLKTKWSTM